jgi:ribose 5-phosphate isomerase A
MNLKMQAAQYALDYVHPGMILGLGSGSTTAYFIDLLGKRHQTGSLEGIQAVPTSKATAKQARAWGIPVTTLSENPAPDLAVDGADEVDPRLNLIKGLGRALLREKVVEFRSQRLIIIVDENKLVSCLGEKVPLPVEIIKFEAQAHMNWLETLGCHTEQFLEDNGSPVVTDNGNYLVGCYFENGIAEPHQLARVLADQPGIVEHGLFLDVASQVIVAGQAGIRILEREK